MLRIAVIGATGAVGRECLRLLDGSNLQIDHVVPVSSARSLGRDLRAELGLSLELAPLTTVERLDPSAIDVAIFSAGKELSEREAPRLAAGGVLVIDNSSAFRMRPDVPLVVPQVNPEAIADRPGSNIVANPNCSTIQLVRAVQPLHQLAGLESLVVATYQAASGGGVSGLAELSDNSARVLAEPGVEPESPGKFGQPLSFNLVPEIGAQDADGVANEERKLTREPRKILDLPQLRVSVTAVRVPVFHCHSEAVHVWLREPVSAAALEEALRGAPEIRVHSRGEESPGYPMPRTVYDGVREDGGRGQVHVGRVRVQRDDPRAAALWVVADNLWVGAALNAVQVAECASKHGWLG